MKELIKKILREEYSPAGKEIIPNEIVVHKSNPMFRDKIMSEGLKAKAGECYRIYAGYGEKCIPAIFATNSKNKRAWFDSTYDDDIWFIDTTKIPDVKWFKDRHYESTKKHIVTFQDIPTDALTLFYEGTGSGDVKTWNKKSPNLYENKDEDFSVEKNIKIINLLLSEISWDGLCEIWVEYNEDDGEYEIRSKTTSRNKEFDEELTFLDKTISSMGLRVFIFAPWFVDSCEDEVKFFNESKEETNYIPIINDLVEPFSKDVGVCHIETWYDDIDDMYLAYLVFGTKELNDWFTSRNLSTDAKFTYIKKKQKEVRDTIESFFPIKNIHVGSYGKPHCGVKSLNESKNKSTKDLIERVLNDLVLPHYKHIICSFELKNVDEKSLSNVFNQPGVIVTFIGGYGTRMWPQTQAVQKMYDDLLDEIWDTVWDYTGISLELYSNHVKEC